MSDIAKQKYPEGFDEDDLDARQDQSNVSSSSCAKPIKVAGIFYINPDNTIQRTLDSRHIQLIAIGGAIGTALFITIGSGLIKGGPLSLLLAYLFWTVIILLTTTAVGEMVSYMPLASPFVSMAGRVVDQSLEFVAGWNFYLMESLYIPFEIVAVNGMIHYWRDDYSPAITLAVQIVIYGLINIFAVRIFGEAEFAFSIGKLLLIFGLLFYTFITMVGGNPEGDAYGFRNWQAAGGPMAEYLSNGNAGRFQGLVACLIQAAMTIVGPEYMSMVAAEAKNPRKIMPLAFKSVIYRLVFFYIGGALCVGIVVAYNDPDFVAKATGPSNAAASPYVVAMNHLRIKVLPDIVNALIISSAFSAGNSYVYCSSRVLYSLALRGHAPKFFSYCDKRGVPIFCIVLAMCFSLLSLMQLSASSTSAFWFMASICTGSQVLNYVYMGITYLGFYRACRAQGIDRNTMPYTSWGQPYSCIFSLVFLVIMVGILGYTNFLPGMWETDSFIFNYIMVFVNVLLFVFWKLVRRTKFISPQDADITSGLDEIEQHEYEHFAALKENREVLTWHQKILVWVF